MITDINIGGVFLPGLLVTAMAAFVFTLLMIPLLKLSRIYRELPFRSLSNLSIWVVNFHLLLQGLTMLGLFK